MITFDEPKGISKSLSSGSLTREADSQVGTSFDAMSANERLAGLENPSAIGPERALAAGVLRQATADLRRFRNAHDAIGREMHSDAKSWFLANDDEWPYSFINVCRALGLSPDAIHDEVFADAQSVWYTRSHRMAGRVAKSIKSSLSNAFPARRTEPLAFAKS